MTAAIIAWFVCGLFTILIVPVIEQAAQMVKGPATTMEIQRVLFQDEDPPKEQYVKHILLALAVWPYILWVMFRAAQKHRTLFEHIACERVEQEEKVAATRKEIDLQVQSGVPDLRKWVESESHPGTWIFISCFKAEQDCGWVVTHMIIPLGGGFFVWQCSADAPSTRDNYTWVLSRLTDAKRTCESDQAWLTISHPYRSDDRLAYLAARDRI